MSAAIAAALFAKPPLPQMTLTPLQFPLYGLPPDEDLMPTLNFMAEFADDVEDGRKRRSIRKRRKNGRDPKPGDRLYLYTGMRQKGCRKLGEAICTRVRPVEIDHMGVTLDGRKLYCGNAPAFDGGEQPENYDSDFARADGFGDFQEMKDWFERQHGLPFSGLLIEWR